MAAVIRAFVLALLFWALAPAARASDLDRWQAHIAEASERFRVPQGWIRAVMNAESRGQLTLRGRPITSPRGAMGLMQLMPATWAEMRAAHGLGSDPYNPRDNVLAGTAYLRAMYDRFGYPGLFAAYNAGPARYSAHLAKGRILPAETRAYVREVTGKRAVTTLAAWAPAPNPGIFTFRSTLAGRADDAPAPAFAASLFAIRR